MFTLYALVLEGAEPTLGRGIAPWVGFALPAVSFAVVTTPHATCRIVDCLPWGHRADHAVFLQFILEVVAGILIELLAIWLRCRPKATASHWLWLLRSEW